MSSYFQTRMAEIRAEVLSRPRPEPWKPTPTRPVSERPVKKRAKAPNGYVYFFRAGNVVKIGFSTNVRERSHSLQTGCSERAFMVKVLPGTPAREREFHRRFAEYRTNGEWFDLRGRLAKYLERDIRPVALPGKMTPIAQVEDDDDFCL